MPSVHHQLDQGNNKNNKGNHNHNNNYYSLFRNGVSGKRTPTLFSWIDNPSMATDAVENGWSRFAFTSYKSYMPSPSVRATLLGSCAAPVGDYNGRESSEAEISWEVSRGSDEFMQKVRLNPGLKKSNQIIQTNSMVNSVIRTALPLPGPVLGNCVFPQESYFEITILYSSRADEFDSVRKSIDGGDKTKLIAKGNSEALVHVTSGNSHKKINSVEEMKVDGRENGKKNESVMFSMGLTVGGPVLLKVPGSYPGSIGFNSNGSVYLDGNYYYFNCI
jgi:hypothetical protein